MKAIKFQANMLTGRLSERDAKRYFSLFGWFAFIFTAVSSAAVSIIGGVVSKLAPDVYSHWLFAQALSPIAFYAIALPIALIPLSMLPTLTPHKIKMPLRDWWQGLCICLALMMIGNYVSGVILTLIESYTGLKTQNPIEAVVSKIPLWGTFLFVVVIAPILEEIVFRGILCKRLLPLGEGYAVALSAACFALLHGNFYQLFYAFTLGCFFSFVYVKTGKLRYTILYHMAINFVGGFISPIIYKKADLESLAESFTVHAGNIFPLIAFLWYWILTTLAAVFGIVIIIKKRRSFYLCQGAIPPPKGQAIKCIVASSGIIASLVLFALILSGSVIK